MNNYKTIHNISDGALTIHDIAPDKDGIGMQTLTLALNQTVDLSTLYTQEHTRECIGLEEAVTSGSLEVINNYLTPADGFFLAPMTTAQRDALATLAPDLMIYNLTSESQEIFVGPFWVMSPSNTINCEAIDGGSSNTTYDPVMNLDGGSSDTQFTYTLDGGN